MSEEIDTAKAGIPQAMMTAVRKVLRPLVRLLISFRITFPQLSEILKSVYVEVANENFRLPDKAQTDTRLSLLTGVHRKDIKRLRNQVTTDQTTPSNVDISTRVIARWIGEAEYLDDNKQPLVIPSKGFDEKAFFLGHNISDHLSAATTNLIGEESTFFERCVYYDGLSDESIEKLQEVIADKGMKTLLEINELAMQLKAKDLAKTESKKRINIGLYAFHELEDKTHD